MLRAVRTARRYGLRETRGVAAHGLLRVCTKIGSYPEAESWGRVAVSNLGREHARAPGVLRDVARLRIQSGDVHRAVDTVQKLLRSENDPDVRMKLLALLARAVASRRDQFAFPGAWWNAWEFVRDRSPCVSRDDALVDLAHAAAAMEDRPRALGLIGLISGQGAAATAATADALDLALAPLALRVARR